MNEIDVKIEGNLISELLNNNEAVDEAVLKLKPEYFFDRTYGIIFKVICNLHKKSHHINDVSVKNYFNNNKSIQFDDYEQIIDSLYLNYFTPGAYSENIDYINCHWMNRELKQIFKESGEKNFTNENYAELGTKIISRIEETMANFNSNDTMTSSKDAVADYEKCLLNNDDKNDNAGLMSGIEPIDNVLRGFKSGKMIIVAARPGIGKSAFALNCAANVAKQLMKNNKSKNVNQKKECIIMFSLEMETKELVGRIISSESKVSFNMCEFEKLGGFQKNSIMAALNDLREMPIFFGTSSSTSMLDIENTLKKYSTTHKIRMVIIDYLGLIDSNLAKRANEEREIAARNSKTIKRLAMHYHIPILLLSQLNRDVESRETHNFTSKTGNNIILEPEPKLRDLALSGSIEQDADIVCFLCKERANDKSDKITIKFIIEKNRDGGNGKIKLLFDRPVQSFIAIKDEKGE